MGAGSTGILPALGASVAGRDMRPAAHSLSFASPKESKQRKGDPKSATPSLRYGANLGRGACGVCRRTHCALARSVQTTAASQSTKHARCDAHARPAPCAPRHGQKGGGNGTGHRCARPREGRVFCRAKRSDGPCRAVHPLWLRLGRSACGVSVGVAAPTHRCLTCRGCLNGAPQARSEFCGTPRKRPDPGLPRSAAKGSQTWGRVLCLLSCTSKKGGRPPGRDPASQNQKEELPTQYHQALEVKINWNLTPIKPQLTPKTAPPS